MSPLFSFRACGINPCEGACAYQSIHISLVQMIQFESTVAVAPMPSVISSASNVHLATGLTSFKTYTTYESHVTTLADQRGVPVLEIGTVVLTIRRQQGAEMAIVSLSRMSCMWSAGCVMFSLVYTSSKPPVFEHAWTDFGVTFIERKDDGSLRYWGFT